MPGRPRGPDRHKTRLQVDGGTAGRWLQHLPGGTPPDELREPLEEDALGALLSYLVDCLSYPRMNIVVLKPLLPLMRRVTGPSEDFALLLKNYEAKFHDDPDSFIMRAEAADKLRPMILAMMEQPPK